MIAAIVRMTVICMKKMVFGLLIPVFAFILNFSVAADLQVISVALVSASLNTGLPTAVAGGGGFF